MGYVYTVVWFLLAAYLIYSAVKRYRMPIMYILSGFMVFLGVWELINTLSPIDLKSGVYGWIYRGVAAVILILCLIWYFWLRNRD
ncbi:MAG: hypothetical protein IJV48_00435 [Ruminococcus sp.]|nr:hypothetical protein [Ruminococcus sp.]